MMYSFVYVFTEDDKNQMLASGYQLVRADESRKLFIFENRSNLTFDKKAVKYVYSNSLVF